MAWDNQTHRVITLARLKVATPDMVYLELRDYGDHVAERPLGSADDDLEATLLARNDPLINLGLAQFGASKATVSALYRQSFTLRSSDLEYSKGLQLACLANQIVPRVLFGSFFGDDDGIDPVEFRRLAVEGDADEISALLTNPSAGGVLQTLYNRKPPFDEISDDRRCNLVYASIKNPRINVDKGNEHGPDMLSWNIHKGIFSLLQSSPIDREWLQVLHSLLFVLDPHIVRTPDTDLVEVLNRWGTLTLKNTVGDQTEDIEGWSTTLSLVDEFRCLIAALYGNTLNKKIKVLGGADDVAMRCAFYGNEDLTIDQMRDGYQRDKEVFMLAALLNDNLYFKPDCRAELEDQISGNLRYMYVRRCEQIHKRWPSFDPRPISETGNMVLDDVLERKPSGEMTDLTQIEARIATLQERIAGVSKTTTWGIAILLAILIFTKH